MNAMDTVKNGQKLTIGKHEAVVNSSSIQTDWYCMISEPHSNNELFSQFGITKDDICRVLGYTPSGSFPQCKTAKDLTEVIEYILSKDPANQKKQEDYTGRTIVALVKSPQSTGVDKGASVKILKKIGNDYLLDKNSKGIPGMCVTAPLNFSEWDLVPETVVPVDMEVIQAECKRKFPIGCKFIPVDCIGEITLKKDYATYEISGNYIYTHSLGGVLYDNGVFATLVNNSKYIPGKWYTCKKWLGASFIKFSSLQDEQAYYTECIRDDGHKFEDSWWSITGGHKLIEVDMNEVSKHLPNNHPDKILYSKEFKVGDWVYAEQKLKSDYRKPEHIPCFQIKEFNVEYARPVKDSASGIDIKHLRLATPEEIHPKLAEECKKGVEDAISKERDAIYAYVGDPLPTKKPLIEDVQSVSVNLRTKKTNNKFKF